MSIGKMKTMICIETKCAHNMWDAFEFEQEKCEKGLDFCVNLW